MSSIHSLTRRDVLGAGATMAGASALELSGCATVGARVVSSSNSHSFERFGVTDGMMRETLAAALSRGGDRADLYFQHKVGNYIALEDGEVNRAYGSVELGVGIRVVKGDQTGYAYTEELTVDSMRRAAQTAAAIADGPSRPAPSTLRVTSLGPTRYPMQVPWTGVSADQKRPLLDHANAEAFKLDARIKKVTVAFADETSSILLVDSDGRMIEDLQPMTSLSVGCVAEHNGRREDNSFYVATRRGFEYHSPDFAAEVAGEAVKRTLVLFDAVTPAAGEMPVVLAAGASGILLHEAIGHGMEADFNRKGISIFADRLNKPVAKPFVNIVDDGTEPAARGSINVDDEGTPAGKTYLVQGGILTTYLHDTISARHYKVEPTGNGRRESYRHAPLPRMRSTYMLPGPHKRDEIIQSVKRGIYCENFTNGQVKIGAGDFTFYVKNGQLIEDGKLTRPIKDVNLIGNGPKILELVDMVADDLLIDHRGWTCGKDGQSVPVSLGLPTVRVSSITVGGRGQKS
jgi:TldD protein